MAVIIVGHKNPDSDCATSMLMLANYVSASYEGDILFKFVPGGKTYEGITVSKDKPYEWHKGDRIYHADVGMSMFDNHRTDLNAPSSCRLIADYINISKKYPEWVEIVDLITREDQGQTLDDERDMANIITGWCRNEDMQDIDVLNGVRLMLRGLLTNQRIRLRVRKEADFKKDAPINDDGKRIIVRSLTRPYGSLGIAIVNQSCEMGSAQGMIGNCVVRIIMNREDGQIRIITQRKNSVDLRELRIVQGIRALEAARRKLTGVSKEQLNAPGNMDGVAWYALENNGSGKVVSLLHGSDKAFMPPEMRTRLDLHDITWMVDMHLAFRL